jgi:hypothetical protein
MTYESETELAYEAAGNRILGMLVTRPCSSIDFRLCWPVPHAVPGNSSVIGVAGEAVDDRGRYSVD